MIVATVKNQLGNQMFAYAVVKTIAQNHNYDFGYVLQTPKQSETAVTNTKDLKYGHTIDTIFPLDSNEKLNESSDLSRLKCFDEWRYILKHNHSFYLREAMRVDDDTMMDGHFISAKYLQDNLNNLRQWFAFPLDVSERVNKQLNEIRKNNDNKLIVGVHFRCAKDYFRYGYMMDYSYWHNAAMRMKTMFPNVHFLLFYDVLGEYVKRFEQEFDCTLIHGSLVEDMYGLSQCDGLIICNSSFSLMSALLNANAKVILCPMHYYSGADVEQMDCFSDAWVKIDCQRNRKSLWYARLKLYKIRHLQNRLSGKR